MNIEQKKVEIAKILNNIGALQFGLFKLSNGKTSPYYVDLRVIPSFPDAFSDFCTLYTDVITREVGQENFSRIAAVPVAGIPFASQVAYNMHKPFLYVRKGAKLRGRERRVEGILVSGDKVLLIDDLATTGLTLKQAAEAVRAEGGVVTDAVAFLDREEGAKEALQSVGIKLHTVLRISEIADTLFDMGSIDEESLKTIKVQVKKKTT